MGEIMHFDANDQNFCFPFKVLGTIQLHRISITSETYLRFKQHVNDPFVYIFGKSFKTPRFHENEIVYLFFEYLLLAWSSLHDIIAKIINIVWILKITERTLTWHESSVCQLDIHKSHNWHVQTSFIRRILREVCAINLVNKSHYFVKQSSFLFVLTLSYLVFSVRRRSHWIQSNE